MLEISEGRRIDFGRKRRRGGGRSWPSWASPASGQGGATAQTARAAPDLATWFTGLTASWIFPSGGRFDIRTPRSRSSISRTSSCFPTGSGRSSRVGDAAWRPLQARLGDAMNPVRRPNDTDLSSVRLRPTREADLPFVLGLEADPETAPFIHP